MDCPSCYKPMRYKNGVYICRHCNEVIREDEIIDCTDPFDDGPDIPEGCAACGGDYPNCADSCPMFDD